VEHSCAASYLCGNQVFFLPIFFFFGVGFFDSSKEQHLFDIEIFDINKRKIEKNIYKYETEPTVFNIDNNHNENDNNNVFCEGSCDTEDFSFPLITGVNYIYTCNPTATFFLFLEALKSLLLTLGKKFNLIKYIV